MSERRYYDRSDEYREGARDAERGRGRDYGGYERGRDRDRNGRRDGGDGYGSHGYSSRHEDRSRSNSSRYEGYSRDRGGSPPSRSTYESSSYRPHESSSSRSYERSRYDSASSSRKSSYDYDSYDTKPPRASSSKVPYYEYEASSSRPSRPYDAEASSSSAYKPAVKVEPGSLPPPMPRGGGGGGGPGPGGKAPRGNRRGNRAICDLVVTRPTTLNTKKGTTGSSITLLANYFRILKKPEWNIYKYRVDFIPEVELLNQKKTIMRRFISKLGSFQFDGSMIYSPYKFQNDPLILVDKDDKDTATQVSIRHVGQLQPTDGQYLHLLNLIMRATIESLNMQRAYGPKGTKYFDALQKIDMNAQHLQIWPGFCTAIRQHEQDILICTELTHKVIRLENCYNVMQHYAKDQESIKKELIGKVVVTEYNNATYRIDDVDFTLSPSSSFEKKNGERITFLQYFRDRYNCTIRDTRQPLLVSRAKAKDVRAGRPEVLNLVPELCRLTGLTEEMRTNFRLMRDLAQHTRVRPDMRVKRFLELNRRIQGEEKAREVMKKWEMNLDRHLVDLPARVLPMEVICFGDRREEKPHNADWTSALTRNRLFEADKLVNWHCVCTNRDYSVVQKFINFLLGSARNSGMDMVEPRIIRIDNPRVQAYINAMEQACNDSTQIIMMVVPNQDASRYSAIKKRSFVDRAVPTQVMLTKVMSNDRILKSVSAKIMVQMNCKLGNAPWTVKIPASGIMTVGFDVTYDVRDKRKSYGALIATMDLRQCNSYFSTVSQHSHGEEMSSFLVVNMMKALKQYQHIHHEPPKRIIFYRDGVGDGDLAHVLEFEVKKLASDLKTLFGELAPKLTFIIVSKRINTRLFSKTPNGGITNAPPGTVVDDVITLPERYDFFIVSQSTKEGTISPTSYNVIFDESGFSADKIQIWTYKMTHLYYNWSGNVKVPAVCQYAQKLAFLVGQFINQEPTNLMERKLYFL
uniref:Putative translation initiation factor 2c eif-2c n=1 Tax=Lutzomyia longipalpis TaxID=7200 RepID=A0A1B0C901_LUTLO